MVEQVSEEFKNGSTAVIRIDHEYQGQGVKVKQGDIVGEIGEIDELIIFMGQRLKKIILSD